ncbi:hypothetical protein GCM10022271_14530 [Corallibacter vietnamensis]|uniref:Lipid/polyisoprenoid-binding YceI-like domain-containing protein n=1 Tax=Corallibacter vietnamensis TaxID=904130 RepID=A0ABP7H344_9FLAO
MKKLILSILTINLMITWANAQHYKTRNGNVQFEASVSGFEEVKAKTSSASAIIDVKTGSVASIVFINAFQFKIALMQEHFNENYMESTTYPKATFKGKLEDFSISQLKNNNQLFVLIGDLTIHGVTQKIEINCRINKIGGEVMLGGDFTVTPEDFAIDIPKLVMSKIAKEIQISFNYTLKP